MIDSKEKFMLDI